MSRKLFITSDISVDERLASVAETSSEAGLLWPWLLTALDDWGRSTAEPKRLKYAVFPAFASVTPQTIKEALALFAQADLITLYEVEGKPYLAVPSETWFKYQTHIRTEKRECDKSRIPAPPSASTLNSAQVRADTRRRAQVRAGAVNSQPSPSPSPSLSPSPSIEVHHEDSAEREIVREAPDVLAADAALSLTSHAPLTVSSPPPQPATNRKPATVTPISAGARVRDPVWDACIAAMGAVPSNDTERGKWAKGIKSLKQSLLAAAPGVMAITPEMAAEIAVRCTRYRARFGAAVPLNPMALAGNWTTLAVDIDQSQEVQRHGQPFQRRYSGDGRSAGRSAGKPAVGTPAYYAQARAAQVNQAQANDRHSDRISDVHADRYPAGGAGEGRDALALGHW